MASRSTTRSGAAGPPCCSSPGPPAMRGTGQRSLTSSPTPARSSPTTGGPTPAAPGRRAGRRPRSASRPTTPPPCCAGSAWDRRSWAAPAPPRASSPPGGFPADLCLRHPRVLQGAIFHEPAFPSAVPDIGAVNAARQARIEEGRARGGPRAAMELYLRFVAGDEVYESRDPQLRGRLLGNAEVLFGIEMAAYLAYDPAPGQLATVRLPRAVTAGAGNRDIAAAGHSKYQARQWLPSPLQTTVIDLPGRTWATSASPSASPRHYGRYWTGSPDPKRR